MIAHAYTFFDVWIFGLRKFVPEAMQDVNTFDHGIDAGAALFLRCKASPFALRSQRDRPHLESSVRIRPSQRHSMFEDFAETGGPADQRNDGLDVSVLVTVMAIAFAGNTTVETEPPGQRTQRSLACSGKPITWVALSCDQ